MSTVEDHCAEQDAITAAYEAKEAKEHGPMTVQGLCENLAHRMREIDGGNADNAERYGLLFDAIQDEALAAGVNIGALLAGL